MRYAVSAFPAGPTLVGLAICAATALGRPRPPPAVVASAPTPVVSPPEAFPEERYAWGPYRVEVDRMIDQQQRARIADGPRVLYEIVDAHVDVSFSEVTGRGPPELRLVNDPGGSCCSGAEHWFTRDRGFKPMFSIDRGRGDGLVAVRDLDGDGRPELLFEITLWASDYISCSSNPECRLDRVVVVGWNGERASDRTRAFPAPSRALARRFREDTNWGPQHRLAGYYGNTILAGDERRARRWIETRLSRTTEPDDAEWFAEHHDDVRRAFVAPVLEP